jgi:hypothetical protein
MHVYLCYMSCSYHPYKLCYINIWWNVLKLLLLQHLYSLLLLRLVCALIFFSVYDRPSGYRINLQTPPPPTPEKKQYTAYCSITFLDKKTLSNSKIPSPVLELPRYNVAVYSQLMVKQQDEYALFVALLFLGSIRQTMYCNVAIRRVRVTTLAAEKREAGLLNSMSVFIL